MLGHCRAITYNDSAAVIKANLKAEIKADTKAYVRLTARK
ncbi:hypothetical protein MGSAQ_002430 [marine sediment metagenome]|uniref:Uncharacterized protein n=1 Tax=marine sediment metagenome TaxID=412755 RepID=A0A1B6NRG8_9ZZZZ